MNNYIVSVRAKGAAPTAQALVFRTNDLDEVVEIFDLMIKYGHTVTVEAEESAPDEQESEERETTSVTVTVRETKNPHTARFACPCSDDGR